jgi:hypothetical protein
LSRAKRVLASLTPEFERGRAEAREWTLDEAVEYSLADT